MDDTAATPSRAPASRPGLDTDALALLQRTASELAAALDVRAAVSAVLRTARDVLGTSTCGVALLDQGGDLLVPQEPEAPDAAGIGLGRPVPLTSSTPSAAVARGRTEVLLRSRAELAQRFHGSLNDGVLALGEHSWAMYPLLAGERLVGVLRLGFQREGSLDDVQRSIAVLLADQCALAVERAQLLTAARDAAVATARSEQRYRTLAEAGRLDVFTAEPGSGLTSDLPGWRALTGRDGDLAGRGWCEDVHPDDLEGVLTAWRRGVREGVRAQATLRLRTPGGWRWLSATAVPVRLDPHDPAGPVLEWVGSLEDVSDRVRSAGRTRTLQTLTAALSTATTSCEVLDAVLQACLQGSGAVRGSLVLVDDRGADASGVVLHRLLPRGVRQTLGLDPRVADDLDEFVLRAGPTRSFLVGVADIAAQTPLLRPFFEAARDVGERAWALLPLTSRRRRLGTLILGFSDPPVPDADEREFLLTFARQVAGALERMQLLEAQLDTATVLQEALQPGPLPDVPWLTAHRVAVTSAGSEVGGDWAELIPVDDERVAVVLGDVMGRGARAATVMGEVRGQVRTLALLDAHPAAVLRGLDACARAGGADDLVTIFYALLHRDGRLLAASAGHLPPLTCSGGGPRYLDVPAGVPIGVADVGNERAEVLDVRLEEGSGLVVFSDGLVETRTRSLTQGLDGALEHFRAAARATPAEIVEALMTEMARGVEADDDVTVLALRLLAHPGPAGTPGH